MSHDHHNSNHNKDMVSHFNKMADSYEKDTRGITRNVATHILSIISPEISASSVIHDNACGPGIVTFEILEQCRTKSQPPPSRIVATDITQGMIGAMQTRLDAQFGPKASIVEAQVRDSQNLDGLKDSEFTHSITGFGIFACPDPAKAAAEIYRTLKPGGVAVVTTWKKAATMDIVRRITRVVRPGQPEWHPISPDWEHDWKLKQELVKGGFEEGKIMVEEFAQKVSGAEGIGGANGEDATEDIVELFRAEWNNMAKKGWSPEERERWDDTLREVLTDEERKSGIDMVAWIGVARK